MGGGGITATSTGDKKWHGRDNENCRGLGDGLEERVATAGLLDEIDLPIVAEAWADDAGGAIEQEPGGDTVVTVVFPDAAGDVARFDEKVAVIA